MFWGATAGRNLVNRGGGLAYERSERAYDAMVTGDYAAAFELYQTALAIDESQEDDWYHLGVCYRELGRHADALPALRRAHELDLKDEDNTAALAETLRELSEEANNSERHERVVAINEELRALGLLVASDWESLGRAYGLLRRIPEARAAYEEALRLDPENADHYQREMARLTEP